MRLKGVAPLSLYWTYFKAGSSVLLISFFASMCILSQVALSASDYWLKTWKTPTTTSIESKEYKHEQVFYFSILTGLIAFGYLTSLGKFQLHFRACLNSAEALHRQLIGAIVRAPIRYFEENSIGNTVSRTFIIRLLNWKLVMNSICTYIGRVLNTCVNDVGTLDEGCPQLLIILLTVSNT